MIAVIPARYSSTRLPGKMLREIAGKPLILHTLDRAAAARTVSRVIVATDDQRIFDVVTANGSEAVMTSPEHTSGSDRIAEVAENLPEGTIIVNVQGDEPMISPETIDRAVNEIVNDGEGTAGAGQRPVDIVTVSEPITSLWDEILNFNVVKVVVAENGDALYFSRSPIPFPREASQRHGGPNEAIEAEPELLANFRKHVGLYVYRREFLIAFTRMPPSRLEQTEMLEQLRALENGARIKVVEAAGTSIGVDTEADLKRVRSLFETNE